MKRYCSEDKEGCGKCRNCGKIKDFTTIAWKTLSEFTTLTTTPTTNYLNFFFFSIKTMKFIDTKLPLCLK